MTLFAAINGLRVTKAAVRVPFAGVWYADVDLDDDAALEGAVVLRLGATELRGTVLPAFSGGFELASRCRVVGGAGGWAKRLAPRHYHNDAKLKVSTIARDAAREVKEQLELVAGFDRRLGADFVRQAAPASRVLAQVLGGAPWWVAFDGITWAGPREQVEIQKPYELLDFDPRAKLATLATEEPGEIGIGSVLRDRLRRPLVVRQLELEISKGALRLTAWGREAST